MYGLKHITLFLVIIHPYETIKHETLSDYILITKNMFTR